MYGCTPSWTETQLLKCDGHWLALFFLYRPSSVHGWTSAFLLSVHRLCGVFGGDWAIFCHAGSGRVGRVRSAREKSVEILRCGWELNPCHGEDRQWVIPLSYHDWLDTAEYFKRFFPGWSHSTKPSWASVAENGSISPQRHHTTCGQRRKGRSSTMDRRWLIEKKSPCRFDQYGKLGKDRPCLCCCASPRVWRDKLMFLY